SAPEDQRGQRRVDQRRSHAPPYLVGRQEARREASLLELAHLSRGPAVDAQRARLADRLQQGVSLGNGDGVQRQDQQRQRDPARASDEQPAPMQARLRLVARTEVFNATCWALLQAHRYSP